MINFEGYHGTDNAHVRYIIANGFKISSGEKQWLGDGVYFFLKGKSNYPEDQAEQWAVLSAWDKQNHKNKYVRYGVLKADISVKESNLLDLTEASGLEIFDYIKEKCKEKLKRLSIKVIDGYLVNFGREELGIPIDVVKGDVFIKLSKEDRIHQLSSRIPNSTICSVFNRNCISNITAIKTGKT